MLSTVSDYVLSCRPCHVNTTDVSSTYATCCPVTTRILVPFSFWPPVFQGLPAYMVYVLPGMVSADHPTLVCYHSSQTHTATVWALIRPRVSPVIAVIVVTAIAEVNPLCIVMLSCFVFVVNPCLCEPYIFPFVPAFVRHAAGSLRFTISPLIHDPVLVYCHSMFHHTDDFVKLPSHGFNCLPSMLHPFGFRHRIIHVLREKPSPVSRIIRCSHSITYCLSFHLP